MIGDIGKASAFVFKVPILVPLVLLIKCRGVRSIGGVIVRGEVALFAETLYQCQFVHHKSHTDLNGQKLYRVSKREEMKTVSDIFCYLFCLLLQMSAHSCVPRTPKARWYLYLPSGVTFNNSMFCPHSCIYVFCVDLRTNSHYFPIQH